MTVAWSMLLHPCERARARLIEARRFKARLRLCQMARPRGKVYRILPTKPLPWVHAEWARRRDDWC